MQIELRGTPELITKKHFRQAMHAFADMLMLKRLHNNIELVVKFVPKVDPNSRRAKYYDLQKSENAAVDYTDTNYPPREFEMEIRGNLSVQKTLTVAAHEMTHVKQFAKQELDHTQWFDKWKWQGNIIDTTKITFWDRPWEIEAYGQEIRLVQKLWLDVMSDPKKSKHWEEVTGKKFVWT